jgi:hypothetical protein
MAPYGVSLNKLRSGIVVGLVLFLTISSNGMSWTAGASQPSQTTYFLNVNVIPMDTERMLENHAVLVQEDRIVEVGPMGEITLPVKARICEPACCF